MATLAFSWGTVRSTAKNIVLSFSLGRNIELPTHYADWIVQELFNNTNGYYRLAFVVPARRPSPHTSGCAIFKWDPVKTKPAAKSILRIGYLDKGINASAFTFILGVTQTLLSYHEATELRDAIRTVAKSAQPAATTP